MATGSRDEVIRFVFETTGDKQLADAVGTLVDAGKAGGEASAELKGLVDQLAALGRQSDAIKQFTKSKADLAELTTKLNEAKAGLAALDAEFGKSDDSSKSVSTAYKRAEKAVADLTAGQKAAQVAFAKAQGTLQKAGIDTSNLAAANEALKEKSAGVAQQIKDAGDAAKKGGDAMSGAAKGAKSLGDESHKSGGLIAELKGHLVEIVSVATAVELALKGIEFGKDAFKGAADVEQSLARVKAIAETTAQSFGDLQEQIDKSAIAANVGTREAANAAALLAEQGQSAEEIFQTLTPTLLLAKDANIELADAAGIVDDALDLFGKNASDASLMVDQLVTASKGSKEGLAGMAQALRTLAPDARELGLSFEQLVGLLGLYGQNGIDAAKASRGLRTVFQDLQDPASKFSIALNALGDSSGNFGKAIETLRNSGANGKQALLSLDGAARSLVEFLLQQGPGAVDAFTASLNNAQGAASKTAAVLDGTLKGAFTSFTNAIDRLGEGLLSTALPPLQKELSGLATSLTAFAGSPAFDGLKGQFKTLFEDAVKAFDKFVRGINWSNFVEGTRGAVASAIQSLNELAGTLKTIQAGINDVGKTFAHLKEIDRSGGAVFENINQAAGDLGDNLNRLAHGDLDGAARATQSLWNHLKGAGTEASNFANALDGTSQSFDGVKSGAASTAIVLETVTTETRDAARGLDGTRASFGGVEAGVKSTADAFEEFSKVGPPTIDELRDSAKSSGDAFQAMQQQILAARGRVDEARKTMDALAASGNTNVEAFRSAQVAWQKAQAELDALTGKAQQAADSSQKLERAFKALHISSQADLDAAAKAAKDNFDVIYTAFQKGAATIEDVRRAFKAYADAQRAQVADSDAWARSQTESQLAVKASLIGLGDEYAKTGKAGQDAGTTATAAFDKTTEAIDKTKEAAKLTAYELNQLADGAKNAASGLSTYELNKAADGLEATASAAAAAAPAIGGVIALTADQTRAMRALNEELNRGVGYQGVSLQTAKFALEQLGSLLGAGEAALRQRIEALNEAAQRAKQVAQDMADQAADLQNQIDQELGKQDDIEERRHKKKLADLEEEAKASGTFNTAAYRKLIELENELHEVKMRNIKKQMDASKAANDGGGAGSSLPTGTGALPSSPASPQMPITINPVIQNLDPAALASALAKALPPSLSMTPNQIAQAMLGEIQKAARAAGGFHG